MTMITKIISLQILLLTACVFDSFFPLPSILSAPPCLNISQPLLSVSFRSSPMSFSTSELVWASENPPISGDKRLDNNPQH